MFTPNTGIDLYYHGKDANTSLIGLRADDGVNRVMLVTHDKGHKYETVESMRAFETPVIK